MSGRQLAPFALVGFDGADLMAGAVASYNTSRSLFEPSGRLDLEIVPAKPVALAKRTPVELWLGDLTAGPAGTRWLAFKGFAHEFDQRPNTAITCYDQAYDLATTQMPKPMVATRRSMADWVGLALGFPNVGPPQADLDLPLRAPSTRTNDALFAKPRSDEFRETTVADLLRRVGERYEVEKHLGEPLSYFYTLDGTFVWKPWADPGTDRHVVAHGRNLVHFDLGYDEASEIAVSDRTPHAWEILPAPWLQPGDTFVWIERDQAPRLASGRFRADTVNHTGQPGLTRTYIYSRTRVSNAIPQGVA